MSNFCGVHIAGGSLKLSNILTNKTTSFKFEKIKNNDIDKLFQWFDENTTIPIDYLCVLMGSEYKSEFRKTFLKAAEKQNKIKQIKIIGIHEAKICNAVQSLIIYPSLGRQLWIFDIRETIFYCTIWEYSDGQWRFNKTWQKVKTIKGADSTPTLNDFQEMKSKIPVVGMPDIFVYHKYSKIDENEFKEVFSHHTRIKFENNYDWVDWTLSYGRYLLSPIISERYNSDILLTREICIMINNQNVINVPSTKTLPYTETMKLRTKKGDTLKVKEDEDVVKKISLVEKHEPTTIALEIDINGIYSLIVKSEEDNTFDIKKLYNIPNKLPRYIQDFHAIGIDLGTTECFCSVIRHDGPRPVQLDPLKHTYNMPSYIIFDEKKPTCGYIAVDKMKTKAEFIVFDAKRFIGKSFDKIALDSLWPFRVFKDAENVLCEVETFCGRERKSPQEISAVLLNRIKTEAQIFEGTELSEVVIGIPSEFSEKQMKATQSAAELAGWQKIHFIPESVAAAFAYCSEIKISNNSNMLIFDFGGGTVDICLAKFKDGHLQILASDGDSFLGGRDYDNILFTHFHGILMHKFGIDFMVQRKKYSLKEICQDIKHTLSANDEAWLNVDDFICDSDDIITITRKEFEDLTSHFLLRIQDVIQRALTKAKISKIDVNYVFRVGGGCRMPMIQKLLNDIFPQSNHQNSNIAPEFAVAHGAALYAYFLKTSAKTKPLEKIRPLSLFNKVLKNNKK